jgi:succinyl-diaminopimelate desuccinylase
MSVDDDKDQLLRWIDEDRDALVAFLARFTRAASPNPPGDTRAATKVLSDYLDERQLAYRLIAPLAHAPNLVASFEGARPGRHLVLNGHIDVFPCDDAPRWTHAPWSGDVTEGRVYGRGVSDMKNGTAALLFVYAYLHRLRDRLAGRLTLTAVSDEETGGRFGAQYLVDNHPETRGDCLLNAEPGAPTTIRFGEKGILRLHVTVRTMGCHGAYTHKSESATKIAAQLIRALRAIAKLPVTMEPAVARALEAGAAEMDRIHVKGAADVVRRYSVNVGVMRGGTKINMLPGDARFEVDIRIPVGESGEKAIARAREIVARFAQATLEIPTHDVPGWSDPEHEMVVHLRNGCARVTGKPPLAITSLAATDARKWRMKGVPAYTYGTTATNVAMPDEHTDIAEWIAVVKTHALAAYDYLARGRS